MEPLPQFLNGRFVSNTDISVVCDVFAFAPIRNFRKDTRRAYVMQSTNVCVVYVSPCPLLPASGTETTYGSYRTCSFGSLLRHHVFVKERKPHPKKKTPKSFSYFLKRRNKRSLVLVFFFSSIQDNLFKRNSK